MTMTEAPPGARSPQIDPRLRQRWVDARRAEGRRRLRVLIAVVVLAGLIAGGVAVVHSPLVRVRHIRIEGLRVAGAFGPTRSELNAAEVVTQAGFDRERPMIDVDLAHEASLVEELPWISSARVVRQWPSTVDIRVAVRTPVAAVPTVAADPTGAVAVVDASGRVLAVRAAGNGLPLIAESVTPGVPGTWIAGSAGAERSGPAPLPGGEAEELALAAALPRSLAAEITLISVASGVLEAQIGATIILFGNTTQLATKVTSLQTLVAQVALLGVAQVDLRVPDRPALTQLSGTTSLSTTAGG